MIERVSYLSVECALILLLNERIDVIQGLVILLVPNVGKVSERTNNLTRKFMLDLNVEAMIVLLLHILRIPDERGSATSCVTAPGAPCYRN